MTSDVAVVEFQAFRGERNEYIVKEFAAVALNTNWYVVILFAPPYEHTSLPMKTQQSNNWLQRHYHRLRWDEGNVPFEDIVPLIVHICSRFTVLYTKGLEKTNFLRQYHGNVIDLNDLSAPCARKTLFSPNLQCPVSQHQQLPNAECALHNALFYATWKQQHK